jgi:ribosomal protein S21
LTYVTLRTDETQEVLLRRFQKKVQASGILREVKLHRYHIPKRELARIKAKRNSRKRRRNGK